MSSIFISILNDTVTNLNDTFVKKASHKDPITQGEFKQAK